MHIAKESLMKHVITTRPKTKNVVHSISVVLVLLLDHVILYRTILDGKFQNMVNILCMYEKYIISIWKIYDVLLSKYMLKIT